MKHYTTRFYPTGWRFKELERKFWRLLVKKLNISLQFCTVVKPFIAKEDECSLFVF